MRVPFFFGSDESLSTKEAFHFKKYLKKVNFFEYKNFLVDPAIFTLTNLDCRNCKLVHPSSCCEDGQPFSMTRKQEQILAAHAHHIIGNHLTEAHVEDALLHGYLETVPLQKNVQQIKKCNGDCFFLANNMCSIHQYAEVQGLQADELKPFSCTLFPLDIIGFENKLVITSLTRRTSYFSRWGDSYKDYICINSSLRRSMEFQVDENNLTEKKDEAKVNVPFELDGYKAAWMWNKSLLNSHFGNDLIQFIERIMIEPVR
jgi:hypothetical protein